MQIISLSVFVRLVFYQFLVFKRYVNTIDLFRIFRYLELLSVPFDGLTREEISLMIFKNRIILFFGKMDKKKKKKTGKIYSRRKTDSQRGFYQLKPRERCMKNLNLDLSNVFGLDTPLISRRLSYWQYYCMNEN